MPRRTCIVNVERTEEGGPKSQAVTHSRPVSCITTPFFSPRKWSFVGSGMARGDTMVGPRRKASAEA